MQEIGFDIISDLNLNPNDSFNWENKATSLYCIVAGNISSNLRTVMQVLIHLSSKYQAVFFVPGKLEYENCESLSVRTKELLAISDGIPNVSILYNNVIVVDGIALLGTNGWGNIENTSDTEKKVSHWVYGTYTKPVDTMIDNINYISNPKNQYGPYHAKRLAISI
jgi:hypothetical protein